MTVPPTMCNEELQASGVFQMAPRDSGSARADELIPGCCWCNCRGTGSLRKGCRH